MGETVGNVRDAGLAAAGLVAEGAVVERVHTGSIWAEGPLWIPARGRLRWSDIPNDCIREFDPATGASSLYAAGVEFTNGRALDRDGSVVQCSHGNRRVERDRDGAVETIVDRWDGARLNSPNDVVVHPDGSIWFTDPPYGITMPREGHPGEREYGDHFVFRVDPAGRVAPVVTDVGEPNGLAFSPDLARLYVADSAEPAPGDVRHIRVYDVRHGSRCKNGRAFAAMTPEDGVSDGIKVDAQGNVWSSSWTGVVVFDPDGAEIGRIPIPEVTANLCFGGPDGGDLYIAASSSIYRVRTRTRDAFGSPAARSARHRMPQPDAIQ
ncbi:MAG: SMP-30/gluconolactonase/LRE family protein [Microbacterium sp.]